MREIAAETITEAIRDMCIEANYGLAPDMRKVFEKAVEEEESPLGRQVLGQLKENLKIAGEDKIPICQDTGMAVVFMKIGQDVHITGGRLADAVNEGVRQGYEQGYLRKSVVGDPIERINTKDNTPAVIHYEITEGDQVDIIDETLLGLIFPQCLVNVDDLLCHLCAFHFNGKFALCVKLITHIPNPGELAVCSPLEFGRSLVA